MHTQMQRARTEHAFDEVRIVWLTHSPSHGHIAIKERLTASKIVVPAASQGMIATYRHDTHIGIEIISLEAAAAFGEDDA